MNNDTPRKISEEASRWIAKLHGGEPSPEQLQALQDWMARSPAHKAEIRQVAQLWGDLNVLTELAVTAEPNPSGLRWANFFVTPFVKPGFAGLAFCLGLITLFTWFKPINPADPFFHSTVLEYASVVGEQRLITLVDGSTLLLNTNSQVTVDYSQEARNVYLIQGQVHFDVESNPDRPFRVYAGQGMVRAVGTAFSVYLKDEFLEVTVTEGSVELNAVDEPAPRRFSDLGPQVVPATIETLAVVEAGQNATLDQANPKVASIEAVDGPAISKKLSWHKGLVRFSGDSLQDVVKEISRYTPLSIVILDPNIRDLRIGGFFEVGETEKMLDVLSSNFGVEVVRVKDNLIHLKTAVPPSQ